MASALVVRADLVDLHACAAGNLTASSAWRRWRGSAAAADRAIPPTGVPGVDKVGVGEPDSVAG